MGGTADKLECKYDQAAGKLKDEIGEATGDEELEAEGEVQNVKGHAKEIKGDVKDALD